MSHETIKHILSMLLLVVVRFPFFTDATHADYQYCISYVFSLFSFKSRMSSLVMNFFASEIHCVTVVSPW